ncbi:MAG: RNA methyltransferase substrate-binding domain-containing protein [Gemmiger formicilis]|uniref:RNA methyltransferase substrate-binding domain-containing protein n=1 Tax=Gemmiger formicilis TaxID=745368 RepID=UPI0039A18D5B
MERFAREQAPERAERTDTLVWGKNAVTELLKSGGAVDTVYLTDAMPQAVAGYYTALAKESGAVVKRVPGNKLQKMCGTPDHQGWPPAPPRSSTPRWTICSAPPRPGASSPFWCCATASRTRTIWGPSCAPPTCAVRTAWSSPSAAASA